MCLGIPGQLVELLDHDQLASVDVSGVGRIVNIGLLEDEGPARCGDIARALATKAAMSSAADVLVSGNGRPLRASVFCSEVTSPADFGLMGSPAMSARNCAAGSMWAGTRRWSMHPNAIPPGSRGSGR